jgi:hypothetical protein
LITALAFPFIEYNIDDLKKTKWFKWVLVSIWSLSFVLIVYSEFYKSQIDTAKDKNIQINNDKQIQRLFTKWDSLFLNKSSLLDTNNKK